jgi:glycosyltransferase involved in cell wall biosynthesis
MRIVIDLQGAQSTGSRNRGIGRYTRALAKAIIRNRGDHEVYVVVSARFPETLTEIRNDFADLLPQENIRVFDALAAITHASAENNARRLASEIIREAFIASLKPDIVHISSHFEGYSDDCVTSVQTFYAGALVAVTLYDLIPMINREIYLADAGVEKWYENRLLHLNRADLLLTISQSAKLEALSYLTFDAQNVVCVGTAADSQFQKIEILPKHAETILLKYRLGSNFIMYTGGIDHRKNIERLIAAYAKLPVILRKAHPLAIVCSCSDADRIRLVNIANDNGLNSGDVVFTGYIPEEDLLSLYNLCKLFVFPSWHEGFGLPALEAMHCGAIVIGSNKSSIPEVIGLHDAMFDPFDVDEIARVMQAALTDKKLRQKILKHHASHRNSFSWDNSGALAIKAFEELLARQTCAPSPIACMSPRPKMAYVSPIPPAKSGIADYSSELIPALSRYYDIDIIVPNEFDVSSITLPALVNNHAIIPADGFAVYAGRYDRVLYHVGNSDHHHHMFPLMADIPGIVVLHDFYLSGIIAHVEHSFKHEGYWTQALYNSHGYSVAAIKDANSYLESMIWEYPCNDIVSENAMQVIVHSEHNIDLAQQWLEYASAQKWAVVPLMRAARNGNDDTDVRQKLGFGPDDFLICSFGMMSQTKRNMCLLNAILSSNMWKDSNCKLVFVGQEASGQYGADIREIISGQELADRIIITGWTNNETYHAYLDAANVAVQLRQNSRGETSAAVLDCLNYALPTIVNAHGSLNELPKDAVIMLPDDFSQKQLADALDRLYAQPDLRQSLGDIGRELILTEHSPYKCAELYKNEIELAYANNRYAPYVAAAHLPVDPGSGLTPQEYAQSLELLADIEVNVQRRVLIDISAIIDQSHKVESSKQKLRGYLRALLDTDHGIRVEPVYLDQDLNIFCFARAASIDILDLSTLKLDDDRVNMSVHDTVICVGEAENNYDYQRLDELLYSVFGISPLKIEFSDKSASLIKAERERFDEKYKFVLDCH